MSLVSQGASEYFRKWTYFWRAIRVLWERGVNIRQNSDVSRLSRITRYSPFRNQNEILHQVTQKISVENNRQRRQYKLTASPCTTTLLLDFSMTLGKTVSADGREASPFGNTFTFEHSVQSTFTGAWIARFTSVLSKKSGDNWV